uniref:MBT domain-containing protein 1 n=1 Tax=Sphaerodactylus townsendi TaxID=933632 RepID=A0ACB8EKR1_9SAUR
MFDGYDSCSEDTSSSSSSDESEEEVAPLPSSLPIIKNNGQVYTYPDGKSGMATCEMCGMVGVRDAFYSKTKRFCSVSCSRSYSSNSKKASILARLQNPSHRIRNITIYSGLDEKETELDIVCILDVASHDSG